MSEAPKYSLKGTLKSHVLREHLAVWAPGRRLFYNLDGVEMGVARVKVS